MRPNSTKFGILIIVIFYNTFSLSNLLKTFPALSTTAKKEGNSSLIRFNSIRLRSAASSISYNQRIDKKTVKN